MRLLIISDWISVFVGDALLEDGDVLLLHKVTSLSVSKSICGVFDDGEGGRP